MSPLYDDRSRARADRGRAGDDDRGRAGAAAHGETAGDRVGRRGRVPSRSRPDRRAAGSSCCARPPRKRTPGGVDAGPDPGLRLRRAGADERLAGVAAADRADRSGRPRAARAEALRLKLAAAGWSTAADAGGAGRAQGGAAAGRCTAWCWPVAVFGVVSLAIAARGRADRWPRSPTSSMPAGDRHARARPPRQDRRLAADRARPADAVGRGRHELRRRPAAAWCAGCTAR